MKLILVDPNPAICNAWKEYFQNLSDIDIVNDYFESLQDFDCMVSAANSFGLMDGGVDLSITRYFGDDLMLRVQERIITEYFGEQPVGTCMIVPTEHPKHPFIAHTPTMRVPMAIAYTDHAYLAMWALLRELHRHNQTAASKIEIVACPALGTGYGRVPPREAARQMALAYRNFLYPPQSITWPYAGERQSQVRYGGDEGLRRSSE
jgi:O-acetyl-ADP-ribose deacetylase (regulator of RNase III)